MKTTNTLLLLAVTLSLFTVSVRAERSMLTHAREAQALLGPTVWSQVVHIDNAATRSAYPKQVDALVFELAGILWIYTDTDGTQSLSLRRGHLEEEKADLGPLLRDIDPGFTRWHALPDQDVTETGPLPNGCFIESIAALRHRLALGSETLEPQLLSFYGERGAGHTVLMFSTAKGIGIVDPLEPKKTQLYPAELGRDLKSLAREVNYRHSVASARTLPIKEFGSNASSTLADARRIGAGIN